MVVVNDARALGPAGGPWVGTGRVLLVNWQSDSRSTISCARFRSLALMVACTWPRLNAERSESWIEVFS